MDLTTKLQIKPGQRLTILAEGEVPEVAPGDVTMVDTPRDADAIVAFVRNRTDLDAFATPAIEAAKDDRLAWIAYPKAGQLGTDLNRDSLKAVLAGRGVQPVRQISIDEVWSALRFRPA
ncbi:hypothetical protein [Streptomyces sp. NPDC059819]|uniref:hypothetical protein n=1 Tax=Streptomyces sp. NPDC059819 TaxID=3346963 RepID=UPI00365E2743